MSRRNGEVVIDTFHRAEDAVVIEPKNGGPGHDAYFGKGGQLCQRSREPVGCGAAFNLSRLVEQPASQPKIFIAQNNARRCGPLPVLQRGPRPTTDDQNIAESKSLLVMVRMPA